MRTASGCAIVLWSATRPTPPRLNPGFRSSLIAKGCAGEACSSLVPTATTLRLAPGVLWVGTRQPATAIAATARPARNAPARTNCAAPSLISLPVHWPPYVGPGGNVVEDGR